MPGDREPKLPKREMTSAVSGMSVAESRRNLFIIRNAWAKNSPETPFHLPEKLPGTTMTFGEFAASLQMGLHMKRYQKGRNALLRPASPTSVGGARKPNRSPKPKLTKQPKLSKSKLVKPKVSKSTLTKTRQSTLRNRQRYQPHKTTRVSITVSGRSVHGASSKHAVQLSPQSSQSFGKLGLRPQQNDDSVLTKSLVSTVDQTRYCQNQMRPAPSPTGDNGEDVKHDRGTVECLEPLVETPRSTLSSSLLLSSPCARQRLWSKPETHPVPLVSETSKTTQMELVSAGAEPRTQTRKSVRMTTKTQPFAYKR
jgi:hypothetical protein